MVPNAEQTKYNIIKRIFRVVFQFIVVGIYIQWRQLRIHYFCIQYDTALAR